MQFPQFDHPVTGMAVPVGALRSEQNCGMGEFRDLKPLADFCAKTGIDLIQLLPVNDTGTESSPYSALSAFALHPVYISLDEIPEAKAFLPEIRELRARFENETRIPYRAVRDAKLDLLRKIYAAEEQSIRSDPALGAWIEKNPWIAEYAVFMNLKYRNADASWKQWHSHQTPTHGEILKRWDSPQRKADHLFYAWVQMLLDSQFSAACAYCRKKGVALKGDIPILMNEDSCDAWANPEFFRDDLRAGNPPDDMNPLGQNWGFPIYNWENLAESGYSWWLNRIASCGRYYDAYRIDHILGFFRIWAIPQGNGTGFLGWTIPNDPVSRGELYQLGFSDERIRWITEPHVPTRAVEEVNNFDYLGTHGILQKIMDRVRDEELWVFKPHLRSEQDIYNADIPPAVQDVLVRCWRDRLLQESSRDEKGNPLYAPVWNYRDTTAWKSFTEEERVLMNELIQRKSDSNNTLWEKQGRTILSAITGSTSMLACAEDLGSIPDCVPSVLGELGILGLKVLRWERYWNDDNQPLKPLDSYGTDSVATTSVHDSSTLRGWWEQEGGADVIRTSWPETEHWPDAYSPETAARLLERFAGTPSRLFVLPVQDFLDLCSTYRSKDPVDDRINIPGTVSAFNWTWRLPDTLEAIKKNHDLVSAISRLVKIRRAGAETHGAEK